MESKWHWLAEVRVPAGDNEYHLSTGVPLSREYVLTTGHGVPATDRVEVRFVNDVLEGKTWRKAEVVWRGGEILDAVLLKFTEVEQLVSFIYSSRLPDTATEWEGAGFPAASKITEGELKDQRNPKGLSGKFLPGGSLKTKELDLTVESRPKIPDKWAGLSGAPVVCGGKLIGIVKSFLKDFDGSSLSAIPMWRLLEDSDLEILLGYDERKTLLNGKKKEIVEQLSHSPKAVAALKKQKALNSIVETPEKITEALFNMNVDLFIKTVYQASLPASGLDNRGREAMENVMTITLPILHEPGVPESIRRSLSQGVRLSLPAATRTFAEIIMAGVDRRAASFCKPVPGKEFPMGSREIEVPPESGFTLEDRDSHGAFDDHLINKFAPAGKQDGLNMTELIDQVNDELEYIAQEKHSHECRHYFIFAESQKSADHSSMEQLRARYPQLTFVTLSGGSYRDERKLSRPLRDFFAATKGEKNK